MSLKSRLGSVVPSGLKDALHRETLRISRPAEGLPGYSTVFNRHKRVCLNPLLALRNQSWNPPGARTPDEPRTLFAFLRHGGIYRSDVVNNNTNSNNKTKPWDGTVPPPDGRHRAQGKERVGRTTLFSSSTMSSGRLFLDRVGRHQSTSPLYRHAQINMRFSEASAKGDISTLPAWGHFYFALT